MCIKDIQEDEQYLIHILEYNYCIMIIIRSIFQWELYIYIGISIILLYYIPWAINSPESPPATDGDIVGYNKPNRTTTDDDVKSQKEEEDGEEILILNEWRITIIYGFGETCYRKKTGTF